MKIYINDVRKSGHCVRGAKKWFQEHDMDFRDFLRNGVDSETFVTKGDGLAKKVVEDKIARQG
jgi:arsenate reductase-like glutaredoxin family protein